MEYPAGGQEAVCSGPVTCFFPPCFVFFSTGTPGTGWAAFSLSSLFREILLFHLRGGLILFILLPFFTQGTASLVVRRTVVSNPPVHLMTIYLFSIHPVGFKSHRCSHEAVLRNIHSFRPLAGSLFCRVLLVDRPPPPKFFSCLSRRRPVLVDYCACC